MTDAWRDLPRLADAARRALPTEDRAIEALDTATRESIAAAWRDRAEAELSAGSVFATLARGLFLLEDVPREVLWLTARAVTDEIRHAEICLAVANRYAGRELPRPSPRATEAARAGVLMHAVTNGAINETIGSAYLQACLEATTAPLAHAATRELLTDEIDHARVGWAILADASPRGASLRADVERHLPSLVAVVRDAWRKSAATGPTDLPREHGCLPGDEVCAIVDAAFRDLVLPGFAHLGVDPRAAVALLG